MSNTDIQEEAPRLEPVVEFEVDYSGSGDRLVLRRTMDGRIVDTKSATVQDYFLYSILKELRTLNATAAAQAEEDK